MKNKGLVIALAVIGVIALIITAVLAFGMFWGRGWFGGGGRGDKRQKITGFSEIFMDSVAPNCSSLHILREACGHCGLAAQGKSDALNHHTERVK